MSSKFQLLSKIQAGPRDVRFKDLSNLMKLFGFNEKTTKHGAIFKHDKLKGQIMPHVSKPHGRESKVLKCYVSECLSAIELLQEGDKEK